ncbi:MAG: hemerythrin domain-containing protein [Candidatus Eremiobacteraeota bacterium]|nr:hemerythrin domain-containing protein [Candidatus Eremiobacteraeota bacterium]MBV8722716.1 hemerythrin domain-containing protein [Candidatus Eremiobacteraeota bacterium]
MDAIALLKRDHAEVKEMFEQVEALSERATATRGKLFQKIDAALELHTQIEEQVFYPAFKERAEDSEEREKILEAFEEHHVAKAVIAELKELDPSDETFAPKLNVLMEAVRHHIKEEEGQLFKMARELFDRDELTELGERLEAAKNEGGGSRPAPRSRSRSGEVEAPARTAGR